MHIIPPNVYRAYLGYEYSYKTGHKYEYSYNLGNSRENWAQKKSHYAARSIYAARTTRAAFF